MPLQLAQQQQQPDYINEYSNNSELFEKYGSNISMQIDYMKSYTKYFPKSNIEEIEKSAIGKKSNDIHN